MGVNFETRGADVVVMDFVGNILFQKAHRYEDIEGEHDGSRDVVGRFYTSQQSGVST